MTSPALRLEDADALIVVPPFAGLDKPSLAAHVLQACARSAGLNVQVLYANLALAQRIGARTYQAIANSTNPTFAGEYLLYDAAYGIDLARRRERAERLSFSSSVGAGTVDLEPPDVSKMADAGIAWAEEVAAAIAARRYRVVGCTTTFEQTSASVALLSRVKRALPEVITVLGGANCHGPMAAGILTLSDAIDFVFSGEAEESFVTFLRDALEGRLPAARIVPCPPCTDLDALPTVDYGEYFRQAAEVLPLSEDARRNLWLPYETSRGCWYGQKQQCRFCGINGPTIRFREKSGARVLQELRELLDRHPARNVTMADCNMPQRYFQTLLPRLPEVLPGLQVFYELKANLSLASMETLDRAGIVALQPGIESLSTACLKLMNKGVTSQQNLALLRYARALDLSVSWNILYGIPNDTLDAYREMSALLPAICHLQPPLGITPVCIERFSPYFSTPERFGVSHIRPLEAYARIFPPGSDVAALAYHFRADYPSESLEDTGVLRELEAQVRRWREQWSPGAVPPALAITRLNDEEYLLVDTRGLPGAQEMTVITASQARLALAGVPGGEEPLGPDVRWALDRKLLVEHDGRRVPLCTADPGLLREMERRARARPEPALV